MQRKPQRRGPDGRWVPAWYPPDPKRKEPARPERSRGSANPKFSEEKRGK